MRGSEDYSEPGMKKKKYPTDKIIRILRQADEGQPVEEEVWTDGNGAGKGIRGVCSVNRRGKVRAL